MVKKPREAASALFVWGVFPVSAGVGAGEDYHLYAGVNCGDIRKDGAVNMYDVAELAGEWLEETGWH